MAARTAAYSEHEQTAGAPDCQHGEHAPGEDDDPMDSPCPREAMGGPADRALLPRITEVGPARENGEMTQASR